MTVKAGAGRSPKNYWLVVAALSGVPLIMVLGNSMLIPVLPDIREALNLSPVQVSLIITLFSLPAGLIIPITGFLSDRYGRKKVIIPALIVYGAGGIIAALAAIFLKQNAFSLVLAGRVIQGIGAAGTAPIAMALCGDLFKDQDRSRSLGSIEASNGLGKVISPVLGAAIGVLAWYAAFVFFPLIVVPVVIGMWLLVKEPEGRNKQKLQKYLESFTKIFRQQKGLLLSSYLAGAIALLVLFGVLFYLSDFLEQQFGLDGIPKGLVLAIPVLFMSSTSFITGFVIKKKEALMKALVVTGLGVMTASLAFLPLTKNVIPFFVGISLTGLGAGLILPCLNMLITSAASIKERGLITSLYGSVRFFGAAAGPPLYGFLMEKGTGLMFWGSAGLALTSGILFFIFGKAKGSPPEKNPSSFVFKPVPASKPGR